MIMQAVDIEKELRSTNPDFVVYKPGSLDGSTFDTGNEHFIVFDGPDGSLMTVWTQSTAEGQPDQRIVFVRSEDEGKTWPLPRIIAGPVPPAKGGLASWGFPLVSKKGRIYVIYSKHIGKFDTFFHTTGLMEGIYSDDAGRSWSKPETIAMPRSIYDNPDPSMPSNWIVWQKPQRLSGGKYFSGFTRWVSFAVHHKPPIDHWSAQESVVEFLRFENIDDDPAVSGIKISYFAGNENALRVGYPGHPELSVVQEPSVVELPDKRLFTVMRTSAGNPYWSVSADSGQTWSKPEALGYTDTSQKIPQPLSPCPVYKIGDQRYMFLFHNHDGHFRRWGPLDSLFHRRPIYLALGEFRKNARQPVWFSEPKLLMDHTGLPLGAAQRCDLAMYASVTIRKGKTVLWYPERKFFLLGKIITDEFF